VTDLQRGAAGGPILSQRIRMYKRVIKEMVRTKRKGDDRGKCG